jgi:hypothetical protein
MKVNGLMIRLMGMESTDMSMELCTRVNGKTTYSMDAELKLGLMDRSMKATMLMAESMESVPINGTMAQDTLVIGRRIRSLASESIPGLMAESMRVNGVTITWKALVSTYGTMVESMRANIRMTRSTGSESTLGQMDVDTKATGGRENNMVSVLILYLRMKK